MASEESREFWRRLDGWAVEEGLQIVVVDLSSRSLDQKLDEWSKMILSSGSIKDAEKIARHIYESGRRDDFAEVNG